MKILAPSSSAATRLRAIVPLLAAGALLGAPLAAQPAGEANAGAARHDSVAVADSAIRDSVEVRIVARRHAGTVRHCYQEQGLKGDPMLRGLLRVELMVLPTGAVQEAAVTAADVSGAGMPAVTSCIATAARAWRFSDGAPAAERIVLEYDLVPPTS